MAFTASTPPLPKAALQLLAAAPHRLLFFVGAANVLLAMAWWAAWLLAARTQWFTLPQTALPAGWMHALIMQYQVLPPFMFGFLLTVFPRWMGLPALSGRHYLPVGIGLLGGQALTLAGLCGLPMLLHPGIVLTILGWSVGLFWLARLRQQESGRTWHAISCVAAMTLGLLGLLMAAVYLHHPNPWLILAAIKIGSFGLLLPIYFTVCHRMVPFFASMVIPGYRVLRPMPALAAFWALIVVHLALESMHAFAWLWLADLPLTGLCAWLVWQWWPRQRAMPALLRVLFLGLAWLPIAFALYSWQSLVYVTTGEFVLGRAPAHALYIGYFGSLLVAMVTRVTQGHSGRPLELGKVATFAFALVQLVAILRIVAELVGDPLAWQAVAALGWLLAFVPWVLRSGWIYLTPRADGKPG